MDANGSILGSARRWPNVPVENDLVREKIPCELTLRPMKNPAFETNSDRVCNRMSRRLFLRATLAGGASLLACRAASLFAAPSASDDSSFSIGGDLPVN